MSAFYIELINPLQPYSTVNFLILKDTACLALVQKGPMNVQGGKAAQESSTVWQVIYEVAWSKALNPVGVKVMWSVR